MTLKNLVTPLEIDPGTVRLVAQRLNHYATPGHPPFPEYIYIYIYIYITPTDRRLWQEADEEGKFHPKLPIMKGANRRYSLQWKVRT